MKTTGSALFLTAAMLLGSAFAGDAVWTATPMSANGDTIRTDGELVYALAGGAARDTVGAITVNGVPFTTIFSLTDYPSSLYTLPFSVNPKIKYDRGDLGTQGVTSPDYAQMLNNGFRNDTMGDYTFTLSGLEEGQTYLFQVVAHRNTDGGYKITAPDGTQIGTGYDTPGYTYGGTLVGIFVATNTAHAFTLTYSGNSNKADFNAFQVRKLSGVVSDPSVQNVSAAVSGTTATISLTGIAIGTDDEAEPAVSYAVSYILDDAENATEVESGLTAENYSFPIADLEDEMVHDCKVIVANDAGRAVTNEISFLVNSLAPVFVPGWTGEELDAEGVAIRKDGTAVWAWSGRDSSADFDSTGEIVVNGVTFNTLKSLGNHSSSLKLPFSVSPGINMDIHSGSLGGEVSAAVTDVGYREMLNNGWWNNANGEYTFTLNGLTKDELYLVQFVFRNGDGTQTVVAPDGTTAVHQNGIGGTLVGRFKAEGDSAAVKLTFADGDDKARLNAIQVRQLSKNGQYVVTPVIGALSVVTTSSKAKIGFPNIALGTDDDGFVAKSFTVAYRLNGGNPVSVPGTFTGATAAFDIKNLAFGSYTCEVTITTDKGTTAVQSVSFTVERDLPYSLGWTAEPMSVSGDTICTDGTLIFAYAGVSNSVVNGVSFKGVRDNPSKSNMPGAEVFCGASYWENPETNSDPAPDAVTDEGYATMLSCSFWVQSGEQTIVLKDLTVGGTYLLQLVSRSGLNYRQGKFFAPGSETICTVPSGDGYPYGSSLVGVFTATEVTQTFVFNLSNSAHLNAIQLRKVTNLRPPKPGLVIIIR